MTQPKPTIAITGANGFLGDALVHHFSEAGYQVKALVRQPGNFKSTGLVTYVTYDITKPLAAGLLKDCDYLVHAAFIKQAPGIDAFELNVAGAKRLQSAASQAKLKKTVFISSMSAHNTATSIYGLQKLAIEKLFNGPSDVCIRSGLILGNGGLVRQMADFMRTKHVVPLIGGGRQPLQTIGVYDLARAIERSFITDVHGILTIATPQVYTYRQFYEALGQRLSTPFVFIPLPYWLLQTVLRAIAALHLPLSVNEDNLIGLKNLRSAETAAGLKRLGITIDDLNTALKSIEIST